MDNLKRKVPEDPKKINKNQQWEIEYWAKKLGISEYVRVRRKKPHSANRKKPIFDKRKEPKLPESDLLFRVIQAVPLQEQPLFF